MADESIFRFLTVRPANRSLKQLAVEDKIEVYTEDSNKTELYAKMREVSSGEAANEAQIELAKRFKASASYVAKVKDLPFNVIPLLTWLAKTSNTPLADLDLKDAFRDLYGRDWTKQVQSGAFQETYAVLADTMLADSVDRDSSSPQADDVAAAFKLMTLMRQSAEREEMPKEGKLGHFVSSTTLLLPDFSRLEPGQNVIEELPQEPDESEQEHDKLRARLGELEQAHREITRLATDERAIYKPRQQPQANVRLNVLENRLNDLSRLIQLRGVEGDGGEQQERLLNFKLPLNSANLEQAQEDGRFVLALNVLDRLSESSRGLLNDLQFDPKRINPVRAVGLIEDEMQFISSRLASEQTQTRMLMMSGVYVDARRFRESLGYLGRGVIPKPLLPEKCQFAVGIGDLLMVKQTLKAYELAEFAHVENVLAGESRFREHRRLNLTEEITLQEEERETEKERNLQSTERNELQSEAEKTIKSQTELEAGLQVSGSYGPAVSFSASLNASFSTTSEESQRKSTSYAREVTEKTAERIRERVRSERRRRVLEEIEETNRHSIDNSDASNGHVRGIYRWLNKIYDAQVFNYGQRMMYEFVIPEPAAYFLYALVDNPPDGVEIIKPEPPAYPHYGTTPLKPSNLTRTNYHDYISKYGVTNAPTPPAQYQTVAYFDKQDGDNTGNFGRSAKVEVPSGYAAYGAVIQCDYVFEDGKSPSYRIMIGGEWIDKSGFVGTEWRSFSRREKELSIAYQLMNARSFTLGVDVFCELTTEGFAKWQHAMYSAILESYLQQKADYDEAIAAAKIQEGVQILGRNPLENRRIEREELKKLVIMMLVGTSSIAKNGFYSYSEPIMNILQACKNGSYIRFFENAFEWNNMLYVLYPYFWGRKSRWVSALHMTDPDPDFAAFLKAGAARVQVPVRPGFEKAVAHFCQYGDIWEGNDIPLIDDELYVPIVDEITENLGKLDDGVPYPEGSEPWEVTVPTSLVVLQNLEEISGIRDILTGNPISLMNDDA